MPKRPSNDPGLFAKNVLDRIVEKYDPEAVESVVVQDSPFDYKPAKNPAAVALGKLGGSKGGHASAASLTPRKRKQIAKKTAKARWSKTE